MIAEILATARDVAAPAVARLNLSRMVEVDWLLSHAALQDGDLMVDVGCGSGYFTSIFAATGARAVGVDPDAAAVERASRRGFERCEFRVGTAESLPVEDGSADAVIGVCAMEHFLDHERAASEFARVLKPGGRLVLSADSLSLPGIPEEYRENHKRRCAVTRFFKVEDLKALLEPRGFLVTDSRYLIATVPGGAAYRILGTLPTFPVRFAAQLAVYPLIHIADLAAGRDDAGMKLCIAARRL